LLTNTKLFCADVNAFTHQANTQVSEVSLALPGTLPVVNTEAIALATRLGLALQAAVNNKSFFARKHYFYPDSPKGYQISQHSLPIISGGSLPIISNGVVKQIDIHHAHLEDDAGKSIHNLLAGSTCVDFNRAGTALIELVTEPCIRSADDAAAFVTELRRLVQWLGIGDGNMEEGSLRCDANISIRPQGEKKLGTKAEVKNLNSIRFIKKAIEVEYERMVKLLERGETIVQETRSYNADNNTTFALREKEEANDYRYMPDPDLPPMHINQELLQQQTSLITELPFAKEQRYINQYNLNALLAQQLCADADTNNYFEELLKEKLSPKTAANWLTGTVQQYINQKQMAIRMFPVPAAKMASLIQLVEANKISHQLASTKLFFALVDDANADPTALAEQNGWLATAAVAFKVEDLVAEVLASMPDKVAEYKKGKKGLLALFTGQVMKKSKGLANAKELNEILLKQLQ
jgi:aspartyl-tRNA(Asn)/glutamyl-tRNA(Gln) amidotransferase subunit B